MDFGGFIYALARDWVGIMSGVGSLTLTIVGFFQKERQRKRWFWAAALVCFFLASVRIWTNEHRAVIAAHNVAVIVLPASVTWDEAEHRIDVSVTLENTSDATGSFALTYSLLMDGAPLKLDIQTPPEIGFGAHEKLDLILPGVFSPSDYAAIWSGSKTLEARVTTKTQYRPPYQFVGRLDYRTEKLSVIESDWKR